MNAQFRATTTTMMTMMTMMKGVRAAVAATTTAVSAVLRRGPARAHEVARLRVLSTPTAMTMSTRAGAGAGVLKAPLALVQNSRKAAAWGAVASTAVGVLGWSLFGDSNEGAVQCRQTNAPLLCKAAQFNDTQALEKVCFACVYVCMCMCACVCMCGACMLVYVHCGTCACACAVMLLVAAQLCVNSPRRCTPMRVCSCFNKAQMLTTGTSLDGLPCMLVSQHRDILSADSGLRIREL